MGKRRRRGDGSIVEVGPGRWRLFVDLGRDPVTGRRRRISRTVEAASREEALRKLERLRIEAEHRGMPMAPANMTVADWIEEWLRLCRAMGLSPVTLYTYASNARAAILPALGHIRLRQLERAHIQRWVASMVEAGYKPTSIAHRRSVLRAALQAAVDQGLIPVNPADRVRIPQAGESRPKVLSPEELRKFLDAAKGSPWYLPIRLIVATGMRRGEVLGLRWRDIDWDAPALHVRQTVVIVSAGGTIRPTVRPATKTKAGARTIYLDDRELLALLRRHRQEQRRQRLQMGPAWRDHDLVFCRPNGEPYSPNRFTMAVSRIAERAGLEGKVWAHALRHTHASTLLAIGWPITEVAHRLGHASPAVTASIYSHAIPDLQARLVKELGTSLAREDRPRTSESP